MNNKTKVWQLKFGKLRIDKNGIDSVYWPTRPKLIKELQDDLVLYLVDFIRDNTSLFDHEIITTLKIAYPVLVNQFINFAYALKVQKEALASGVSVCVPDSYASFHLVFNNKEIAYPLINGLLKIEAPLKNWRKLRRYIWGLWLGFKQKIYRSTIKPIIVEEDIITTIVDPFAACLALQSLRRVVYLRRSYFFENITMEHIELTNKYNDLKESLISGYQNLLSKHDLQLAQHVESYLSRYMDNLLPLIEFRYKEVINGDKILPKTLWVETGGSIHARILSAAVMNTGGTVTRFDHGGGTIYLENIQKIPRELTLCNVFYTYSQDQADLLSQSLYLSFDEVVPEIRAIPRFIGWTNHMPKRKPTIATNPKKIMYLSSYFFGDGADGLTNGNGDVIYLDWMIRIITMLEELGFDVLHKPHPVTARFLSDVPSSCLANVLSKNFEECLNEADVVVLDHPSSTTFNTALASDLPVVLVDLEFFEFVPAALEKAKKRCSILKADFDSSNRAYVTKDNLQEAIKNSLDLVGDTSFADSYFQFNKSKYKRP